MTSCAAWKGNARFPPPPGDPSFPGGLFLLMKVSRKDIARMSAGEFIAAARGPYGKLFAYLKPWRARFLLGLLFGALYGAANGLLVFTIHGVTEKVLPPEEAHGKNNTTLAESWHPDLELPELRAALVARGVPEDRHEAVLESYSNFRRALYDRTLNAPPPPPAKDPLLELTTHPAMPAEFALTLEGERRMTQREPEMLKAREAWKAVLELPEEERRHRTLWARYFLTHSETVKHFKADAAAAFQRDLETGKFTDVLKLRDAMPKVIPLSQVILVCASIPGIMLIRAIFGYLNTSCLSWVSLKVLDKIRGDLFSKVLNQSLEFFNKKKSGDLLQTVVNQTRVAQQGLTGIVTDIVKEPLAIVSALAVLFFIDWKFTLLTFTLFPLCIIPVNIIGRKVRKAGAAEEAESGNLSVILQEAFSGIRVVKAYGREAYETERFNESNLKMLRSMLRWRRALEGVGPFTEVIASVGVAAALVYVYLMKLPASSFIALNAGLAALYGPAKSLSRVPLMLQKCLAATSKVFDLMEHPSKVQDKPDALTLEKPASGCVRFKDVSFFYRKDVPAVRDINLTIAPGETCALVGPSGAGKSTLFSLLLRFYDPHAGTVFLDNHPITDLKQHSLREQIGIVSQDVFLFHDTIYENIRYGKLDATREEIEAAACRAHAHEFIMAQPQGYDTVVGDKGCNLSGGQQQRISIARAMLRNAPILLLDEATSALDTESERKIQEAIEDLSRGKTVIAIAHRLSTILNADRIVVMDRGVITATGTHEELLRVSELYRKLYNMQFHTGPGAQSTSALTEV